MITDEELIGKEVYGFKFPNGYAGIAFVDRMNYFTGKIGRIESVNRLSVKVVFPVTPVTEYITRCFWHYPKSMVIANLIIEDSENKVATESFENKVPTESFENKVPTESFEKKVHEIFKIL